VGGSCLRNPGQPFALLALFDLLLHGLVHLIEHLLVKLKDVHLVTCLIGFTIQLLHLQLERLDTDRILERELSFIQLVGLVFLAVEPVQLVIEFFLLLDHSFQGGLRLEQLSSDLVVLSLELGKLVGLLLDGGILFVHFLKLNQFFVMLVVFTYKVLDHFLLLISNLL